MISLSRGRKLSLLDLSYYLFMASVPIEALGTLYYNFWVSLSFPTGVFFVFCYLFLQKGKNAIKWPPLMTLPFIWLFINIFHYISADSMQYFGVLTGVFNNLLFAIILYNYLVQNNNIKSGLLVMGLATSFAGSGILASHGLEILAGGRFSILDFDENNIGSILALGSLILIMFAQEKTCKAKWSIIYILLALQTLAVVVATGSRGAMLSFVLSLIFYLVIFFSKELHRTKNFFIILAVVCFSIYFYQHSTTARDRWQATLRGDETIALSERDVIFEKTLEMIFERPILGWGLLQAYQELGQRMARTTEVGTHNSYLIIFVTTGVFGSLPFMIFFIYPFAKFKEHRDKDPYKQILVLLVFVMLVSMSLDWLNRKQMWIFYSILLAYLKNIKNGNLRNQKYYNTDQRKNVIMDCLHGRTH